MSAGALAIANAHETIQGEQIPKGVSRMRGDDLHVRGKDDADIRAADLQRENRGTRLAFLSDE